MPRNPSHAIATLTDVPVNDLNRVEMSTYHAESTNCQFQIYFMALPGVLTSEQVQLSL